MQSFYWHDYETWGVNPAIDRPAQFAGLRTDEDLNVLGDPLVIYCRPAEDVLPHPEACMVTGIAPQLAEAEGYAEPEFIQKILAELGAPGTCGVGYNSLRFDDEVTRYTAYRNFYDPYEREWKNGNSRWDIIDMVRACFALRPEGIEWPMVDGKPSFRLELLTEANGIAHAAAHDALSDVEATIALARLIKNKQPGLYDFIYQGKSKASAAAAIDLRTKKPILHVSSMFKSEQGCTSLVMPLAMHPSNKNAVIAVDLTAEPDDLIHLDADAVCERVFTAEADLTGGAKRIPLKLIHLNKSPILLTPKLMTANIAKRLSIDLSACESNWKKLLPHNLQKKVQYAMTARPFPKRDDPEQQLYDGFLNNADKPVMEQIRLAGVEHLKSQSYIFKDKRLQEMLLRYKGRNYPGALSESETVQWFEFCQKRLSRGELGVLSIDELKLRINELGDDPLIAKDKKIVLQQLYRYAEYLEKKYQLGAKCKW